MKKICVLLSLAIFSCFALYAEKIASPNGKIAVEVNTDANGQIIYTLSYNSLPVILPSRMGFEMEQADLMSGFTINSVKKSEFDEVWQPVWGQYKDIRNHYNELDIEVIQPATGYSMWIEFRVYNDGIGFRYNLPAQDGLNYLTIKEERTEFNQTGNHIAFCIPNDYDSNEFVYTTKPLSEIKEDMEALAPRKGYESKAPGYLSVQTPLLLKTSSPIYINIHEAGLIDFPAMALNVDDKTYKMSAHLVPDKLGKKGYLQLPVKSPWRTIMVSDDARDMLASSLIFNLNEPCKIEDTSWIVPMKYVGVWWEMFIGANRTWAYSDDLKAKPGITDYSKLKSNGRHPANTENVKMYIDFAAKHGFDAVLVEGWNEGWEDWESYKKDKHFMFNKPYPDFDIDEIQRYAQEKGVKMIMHHETSSNATNYERNLDVAFQYMVDHNYHAVKTGYVGYMIPRSEYHYSQWMNEHYAYVAERAADYKIMINSHEATRPTGLNRTWPNWASQESARGGEFESMGGNNCDHQTILPFTRLIGGPMDYTPGVFQTDLSYYKGEKQNRVSTTLVKQLALYVTMPSPVQMASDLPSNYERFLDAFQFIKDVAVAWDNSWYLEAEPGDYITVARQAKDKNEWFIGAITDENPREAKMPLSFLPEGKKYIATIYEDGKDAHWHDNPQSYNIRKVVVTNKSVIKTNLASSGGTAISIKEANKEEMKGLKRL